MKLTSLSPRWIGLQNWASSSPFYLGVSFLCPHCGVGPCPTCGKERGHRLAVNFWPPIDPDNVMATFAVPITETGHKRLGGETFETLTLHPSIGFDNPPHFHGCITNGEVTNSYPSAQWAKGLP